MNTELKKYQNFSYNGRLYVNCGGESMSIDHVPRRIEYIKTPAIDEVIILSGHVEVPIGHYYFDCNGYLDRDDGPACISTSGYKLWYKHGKAHRIDGPAVISPDGTVKYFVNGNRVTEYEVMFMNPAV